MIIQQKMAFEVKGRLFEIVIASDVLERDGLGGELWERVSDNNSLLAEIFRHDNTQTVEFTTYSPVSIPFDVLEIVINDFNRGGGREFIIG